MEINKEQLEVAIKGINCLISEYLSSIDQCNRATKFFKSGDFPLSLRNSESSLEKLVEQVEKYIKVRNELLELREQSEQT